MNLNQAKYQLNLIIEAYNGNNRETILRGITTVIDNYDLQEELKTECKTPQAD